jgi:hypothetical protein
MENPLRDLRLNSGNCLHVEFFDLLPGPGRAAEKLQARFDTGLEIEAADVDSVTELGPAVLVDETREHHLQRDSMERIF